MSIAELTGEDVFEELRSYNQEMIILCDDCREVGEIYINAALVYPCDSE